MEQNKNVFEETVKSLTKDAMDLQVKLSRLQEKNDYRGSIEVMRLLKDTLSLIKEYDWQLEYSEYTTDGQKQIAVWEQNHCGDIKNHKKWDVKTEYEAMYIDYYGDNQAIVYYNGKREIYDIANACGKQSHILLGSFLNSMDVCKYEIYLDNRGFRKLIEDVLCSNRVPYKLLSPCKNKIA